ncbi:hypothetical protein BV25DRAFT_329351 [Artomyces pyxidatus]|uniref:Uncharacterized protein n=1 Tax=Artomyces pyxidatus TaxID=48021 RepID=A0ACB8T5G3_9AGAM|nr:hypothetical protein BV25DRAFT_329351 [Artomyces pyxidatus]
MRDGEKPGWCARGVWVRGRRGVSGDERSNWRLWDSRLREMMSFRGWSRGQRRRETGTRRVRGVTIGVRGYVPSPRRARAADLCARDEAGLPQSYSTGAARPATNAVERSAQKCAWTCTQKPLIPGSCRFQIHAYWRYCVGTNATRVQLLERANRTRCVTGPQFASARGL